MDPTTKPLTRAEVNAAIEAQKAQRALLDKQHNERLENAAATTIQAEWRGFSTRKTLEADGISVKRVVVAEAKVSLPVASVDDVPKWDEDNFSCTITAMRLDFLVAKFTENGFEDAPLLAAFLTVHTDLISSLSLLQCLEGHFASEGGTTDRCARIIGLVGTWVTEHTHCFANNVALSRALYVFLGGIKEPPLEKQAQNLLHKAHAILDSYDGHFTVTVGAFSVEAARMPKPFLPSGSISSVCDLNPVELARQITLLDYEVLYQIRPSEYLGQGWCKRGKEHRAAHLLDMINRFNITSRWTQTEILKGEDAHTRAHAWCALLDTAAMCLEFNNYNGLMAILSGLHSAPISRMRQTIECLPAEYIELSLRLNGVMAMDNNFREYRDRVRKCCPPCIPYMGVFLQDLTFTDDANKWFVDGMLNVEKMRMTMNIITQLSSFSTESYKLQPVLVIAEYLLSQKNSWTDKELYDKSLELEPRAAKLRGRRRTVKHVSGVQDALRAEERRKSLASSGSNEAAAEMLFVQEITHRMVLESYKRGEYIVRKGGIGTGMYFIAMGTCEVELPNTSVLLNQGDYFGEIALFLSVERVASVRALTEVEVLMLRKTVCEEVMKEYPEVEKQFVELGRERYLSAGGKKEVRAAAPKWMSLIVKKDATTSTLGVDGAQREVENIQKQIDEELRVKEGLEFVMANSADPVANKDAKEKLTVSAARISSLYKEKGKYQRMFSTQHLEDRLERVESDLDSQRNTKKGLETLVPTYEEHTEVYNKVRQQIAECEEAIRALITEERTILELLSNARRAATAPTLSEAAKKMDEERARLIVDTVIRMWIAKRRAQKVVAVARLQREERILRENREARQQAAAATTLQAAWRGYSTRKVLSTQGLLHRKAHKDSAGPSLDMSAVELLPVPTWPQDHMRCDVTAATVKVLLAKLIETDFGDSELRGAFLGVHTALISTEDLLDHLTAEFQNNEESRHAVIDVVTTWINSCVYDFVDEANISERLVAFFRVVGEDPNFKKEAYSLAKLYKRAILDYEREFTLTSEAFSDVLKDAPKSILPKKEGASSTDHATSQTLGISTCSTIHPVEIARQLTLLDFMVFVQIRPKEYLSMSWTKPDKETRSPHVLDLIQRFNDVTQWASTEIVRQHDLEQRVHIICHLIDVSLELRALRNFSSLMAILAAFHSAPVARLRATFESLPGSYAEKRNGLMNLMAIEGNFRSYRELMKKTPVPCIPYLGLYLQDLANIEEGSPSMIGCKVNVVKYKSTHELMCFLDNLRKGRYALHPVMPVQNYLQFSENHWDGQRVHVASLKVEPKGQRMPRKKTITHTMFEEKGVKFEEDSKEIDFVQQIAHRMTRRAYAVNEGIVRKGQTGKSMFFIVRGVVEVVIPNGGSVMLNQGDFFGEIALFLQAKRTADVRAHTACIILELTQSVCDEALEDHPAMLQQFRQIGQERLEALSSGKKKKKVPNWMRKLASIVT